MTYTSKFISKKELAKDTYMFTFKKPVGFEFEAGQFTSVFLPGYSDKNPRDHKHTFSIASSPTDNEVQIATRIRKTEFKSGLMKLKKGTEVQLGHPGGSMTLPEDMEISIVFLVGGIGITPVRGMLRYIAAKKKNYKIKVIYSNKKKKTTAFFDELTEEYDKFDNIEIVLTMTDEKGWQGEKGRINKKLIEKVVGNIPDNLFYVVGSELFNEKMSDILVKAGVKVEDIKSETFFGYD
ncbi:MAG TPA: FAD-dependent oxidoreductase [bacterium]|nr:FAD-dependent oxidoreductase [bacterium]